MVIQLDPGFADAYSVLASYAPDNPTANAIYLAGLKANPDSFQLNFEYGSFYQGFWTSNPRGAIPYLRKAVRVAPDKTQKVKAMRVLAHLYRRTGQTRQSIATWEEIARIEPGNPVAQRELSDLRAGR